MFSAVKNYAVAILGIISAVLLALLYRSKAKYEKTVKKSLEAARETEKRSTQAMVKGLDREEKARAEVQKRIAEFARNKRT